MEKEIQDIKVAQNAIKEPLQKVNTKLQDEDVKEFEVKNTVVAQNV